jgi:hypothetical protein
MCSNTSPYPKANLPRGGPLPTGMETNRAVAKPAATGPSPLSNTHELAGSRRTHRTAPSMTRRYATGQPPHPPTGDNPNTP